MLIISLDTFKRNQMHYIDQALVGKRVVITCGKQTLTLEAAKNAETEKPNIVDRVLAGEFGIGAERKRRLTIAGYDYVAVQNAVNERLGCPTRH